MPNPHHGNLADVFKHLALAEVLGAAHPSEYWESHAGSALYPIPAEPSEAYRHGIGTFLKVAATFDGLRLCLYHRVLTHTQAMKPPHTPGSPLIARALLGEDVRRLLFCDQDADSLQTIRQHVTRFNGRDLLPEKIEIVQDDGIMVLRGAGMLLSDNWIHSTLAFIDPFEMHLTTDSGISPLEFACELANRGIPVLLFYGFADNAERAQQQQRLEEALTKARLKNRGSFKLEGSLKKEAITTTQWGFGLLTMNIRTDALERVDKVLRLLEAAYEQADLNGEPESGSWRYSRAPI